MAKLKNVEIKDVEFTEVSPAPMAPVPTQRGVLASEGIKIIKVISWAIRWLIIATVLFLGSAMINGVIQGIRG